MTDVKEAPALAVKPSNNSSAAAPSQAPVLAVRLALQAGWTMAVLYGKIQPPPAHSLQLPTVHELEGDKRRELEFDRLRHLIKRLAEQPECEVSGLSATIPALPAPHAEHAQELEKINLSVLKALTATRPEIELAYELGRSLRDTANPPADNNDAASLARALEEKLNRERIAKLREWLATLAPAFPQHAAAAVAASIGRWSEFAGRAIGAQTSDQPAADAAAKVVGKMREYLLPQGDVWLMLLTGERSTAGLLTPEGYVAAGEDALHRTARIVRQIIKHYWPVWVALAVVLGGVLYLAIADLAGAAKVWTSIASIAGTLGASARTIASSTSRLAAEAERPIFAMAEEDVMAWAVTTLPPVTLPPSDVRKLRKAGIHPPSALGRT